MTIPAYPLSWPEGWKRTPSYRRGDGNFKRNGTSVSIPGAVKRVLEELRKLGVSEDDLVISTNLKLRLDGLPRGDQGEPGDPGVAVYWRTKAGQTRCMAIDRYSRVAQNIAAVAATLEAMRAIERHGGAEVLDRAFTGFDALPSDSSETWHVVLGVPANAARPEVEASYRQKRSEAHPDRGGTAEQFQRVQRAWESFCKERGIAP